MLTYRVYTDSNFKEANGSFFDGLLDEINRAGFLSPTIDEIVVTDDLAQVIASYNNDDRITRSREFTSVAKIIRVRDRTKVLFDVNYINRFSESASRIFFGLLIEVYAEDIVAAKYSAASHFAVKTPLIEIVKLYFYHWATKAIGANVLNEVYEAPNRLYGDIKIYVDAFKRNVRRLHFQYQKDENLDAFWISTITEVDFFVRRCLDVRMDKGSFDSLQEFSSVVPILLDEINVQAKNLLDGVPVDLTVMTDRVADILKECSIKVPTHSRMHVKTMDSPVNLFNKTVVDTEPRIVAFIDILGFSDIIREYDTNDQSNILNELHETLQAAVKVSISSFVNSKVQKDAVKNFEYRMFSDCLCLSLPYIDYGNDFHIQFYNIALVAASYQIAMMQKGFFVRGGISMGGYYSDSHMIFSGGLVSAYRMEQKSKYPVIGMDEQVLVRLNDKLRENTEGLAFDNIVLSSGDDPNLAILNPFFTIDTAADNLRQFKATFSSLSDEFNDGEDSLEKLTKKIYNSLGAIVNPILEQLEPQMSSQNMNKIKEEILLMVLELIEDYQHIVDSSETSNEVLIKGQKVLEKYLYLKKLIEWSLGKVDSSLFKEVLAEVNE